MTGPVSEPTTASDAAPATILLTGRGPDLARAAETLGALRGARLVYVQPEAPFDGLVARNADLLVLAGDDAIALCHKVRAQTATLPIFVLGADVVGALAAGANDGLAGAWAGEELAARARSLLSTRRRFAEALAQARAEARHVEGRDETRTERRLNLLARAGQALAEPLDVGRCIAALAHLVVPELAISAACTSSARAARCGSPRPPRSTPSTSGSRAIASPASARAPPRTG